MFNCILNLFFRNISINCIRQIFIHSPIKNGRVLCEISDTWVITFERYLIEFLLIDYNISKFCLDISWDKFCKSWFPSTTWSNKCCYLTPFYLKIKIMKNCLFSTIWKRNIFKLYISLFINKFFARTISRNSRCGIIQFPKSLNIRKVFCKVFIDTKKYFKCSIHQDNRSYYSDKSRKRKQPWHHLRS